MKRWRGLLEPLLTLLISVLAVWLLHRQLAKVQWHEVLDSLQLISASRVAVAVGLTVINYWC